MDIVLGVSMAPTSVRMLLVEGENAAGVTVEDSNFDIATDDDAATLSAADQVVSAILGTREGATQAGHALASTGVTWTDPVDAAALHEALATRKVENVMLVSAFMAAAALAQMVGSTVGDAHTALLFLEPDTATLAVVDSADGSITDVHKELMSGDDTVAALAGMVAGLDALETRPQSVFIVGSGVDVAALKPQLEAVTSLPVTAAEEPETALAWGAALASASAPLFASSTAALAYAQDPGTGAIDPYAVSPGYLVAPDVPFGTELGEEDLAYSAVPDEEAEAHTAALAEPAGLEEHLDDDSEHRPLVLIGSVLAVVIVAAFLSLEVALALGIRPSAVALLPRPLQNLIVPAQLAPAPAAPPASAPSPQANHLSLPRWGSARKRTDSGPTARGPHRTGSGRTADTYRGPRAGGCSDPVTNSGACAVADPRPVSAGAHSPAAAGAHPVAAGTVPGRPGSAGAHAAWPVRWWRPGLPEGTPALAVHLAGLVVRLAALAVGTRAWRWTWWVRRSAGGFGGGNPGFGGPGGFGGPSVGSAVGTPALVVLPADSGVTVDLAAVPVGLVARVGLAVPVALVVAPVGLVVPVASAVVVTASGRRLRWIWRRTRRRLRWRRTRRRAPLVLRLSGWQGKIACEGSAGGHRSTKCSWPQLRRAQLSPR